MLPNWGIVKLLIKVVLPTENFYLLELKTFTYPSRVTDNRFIPVVQCNKSQRTVDGGVELRLSATAASHVWVVGPLTLLLKGGHMDLYYFVLYFYVVPGCLCLMAYMIKAIRQYIEDRRSRAVEHDYDPKITIGTLMFYVIVSMIPILNWWMLALDVSGVLIVSMFDLIDKIASMPLVPRRNKSNSAR